MRRYLYRLVDNITGKLYIGSTDHLQTRWRNYRRTSPTRMSAIFNRIREIGIENFSMIEMCQGSDEYIRELEKRAIKAFNSINNPYDLIIVTRLIINSIRMHCNRETKGFKWL